MLCQIKIMIFYDRMINLAFKFVLVNILNNLFKECI